MENVKPNWHKTQERMLQDVLNWHHNKNKKIEYPNILCPVCFLCHPINVSCKCRNVSEQINNYLKTETWEDLLELE